MAGLSPRRPIDLVPALDGVRLSLDADNFSEHIRTIHEEVRQKLQDSYAK